MVRSKGFHRFRVLLLVLVVFVAADRIAPPSGVVPTGMHTVLLVGRNPWFGWLGRFDREPPPASVGTEVKFPRHFTRDSSTIYQVIFEAQDGRDLRGCVVGYWTPDRPWWRPWASSWRFRVNRPLHGHRIAAQLFYSTQRFAIFTADGQEVKIRVLAVWRTPPGGDPPSTSFEYRGDLLDV